MEFYLKKNSTLPLLKLQVVKDGRSDYQSLMNLIEVSSIFFSMTDTETGIPKITSRPGGFVNKTFLNPNTEPEYYIYYQFTNKDTNRVGRYEGQFMLRTPDGVLILPIREKLYINIQESFVADDLDYNTCYVSEFPCCVNGPLLSASTISDENTFNPNIIQLKREHKVDERDNNYLIENHFPESQPLTAAPLTSRFWDDNGWWGNQGNTPQCVAYAWAHWLEDGPVYQSGKAPIIQPSLIYENAQKLDEWPGENYAGTSVRGGVKYLRSVGKVTNYYWTSNIQTLINTILYMGPVVVGTNWYWNMFYPNSEGILNIGGKLAGGHAYVINGVDTKRQLFRIKNSWGRAWGKNGSAYIRFYDMKMLIAQNGEVCLAIEVGS